MCIHNSHWRNVFFYLSIYISWRRVTVIDIFSSIFSLLKTSFTILHLVILQMRYDYTFLYVSHSQAQSTHATNCLIAKHSSFYPFIFTFLFFFRLLLRTRTQSTVGMWTFLLFLCVPIRVSISTMSFWLVRLIALFSIESILYNWCVAIPHGLWHTRNERKWNFNAQIVCNLDWKNYQTTMRHKKHNQNNNKKSWTDYTLQTLRKKHTQSDTQTRKATCRLEKHTININDIKR